MIIMTLIRSSSDIYSGHSSPPVLLTECFRSTDISSNFLQDTYIICDESVENIMTNIIRPVSLILAEKLTISLEKHGTKVRNPENIRAQSYYTGTKSIKYQCPIL